MRFNLWMLVLTMALVPPLATAPAWISDPHWSVHRAAGACSVASYCLAVLLLAGIYRNSKNWLRPPRKTPLLWALVVSSLVSAAAGVFHFVTHPYGRPVPEVVQPRWMGPSIVIPESM